MGELKYTTADELFSNSQSSDSFEEAQRRILESNGLMDFETIRQRQAWRILGNQVVGG